MKDYFDYSSNNYFQPSATSHDVTKEDSKGSDINSGVKIKIDYKAYKRRVARKEIIGYVKKQNKS